jgi:hypothetical protein
VSGVTVLVTEKIKDERKKHTSGAKKAAEKGRIESEDPTLSG